MSFPKITPALLISFVLAFATVNADAQEAYKPVLWKAEVGMQHDDFELPNIQTNKLEKLSNYRGKKVLLLHFASW